METLIIGLNENISKEIRAEASDRPVVAGSIHYNEVEENRNQLNKTLYFAL